MISAVHNIIEQMSAYTSVNSERIERSYRLAEQYHRGQTRMSGEEYIFHPLAVAQILVTLEADEDTVIAAILHDTIEDTDLELEIITAEFGDDVSRLVDGVTKISKTKFRSKCGRERQFASLRKLFAIMATDIRCVIIKICDRLHNMRTIGSLRPDKQARIARETLQIYVPIAKKLNLEHMRHQLLSMCNQILFPDITTTFEKTQQDNTKIIELVKKNVTQRLTTEFQKQEYKFHVFPKIHFILEKDTPSDMEHLEITDTYILQIIVPNVHECYQALFLLHQVYKAKPDSFRDYITTPKINGYQALHTQIIDSAGNIINIQIVTPEMALISQRGISAYWKGNSQSLANPNLKKLPIRIKWLEELALFADDTERTLEEMDDFLQKDFLSNRIFIIDNSGKFVDMPEKSTVLDFLYAYFPDKAGFVTKVSINTHTVSLDHKLSNGDKIEFEYGNTLQTNISWLGFVTTYSSQRHIGHELEKSAPEEKISLGEKLLQYEFDIRHKGEISNYAPKKWNHVLTKFKTNDMTGLCAKIGAGKVHAQEVCTSFFGTETNSAQDKKPISFHYDLQYQTPITAEHITHLSQLSEKNGIHISQIQISQSQASISGKASRQKSIFFFQQLSQLPNVISASTAIPLIRKILLILYWSITIIALTAFALFIHQFPDHPNTSTCRFRALFPYIPAFVLTLVSFANMSMIRTYFSHSQSGKKYLIWNAILSVISIIYMVVLFSYTQMPFSPIVISVFVLLLIAFLLYQHKKVLTCYKRNTITTP